LEPQQCKITPFFSVFWCYGILEEELRVLAQVLKDFGTADRQEARALLEALE
jgi:hypothetical protein